MIGRIRASLVRWERWRLPSTFELVTALAVIVVFGVGLPAAFGSALVAVCLAGMLGLVILVIAVGSEKASTVLLVLAFGFAPLTNFALGPKPLVLASAFFAIAFGLALPRLIHRPLRLPTLFVVGSVLFTVMGFVVVPRAIDAGMSLAYIVIAVVGLIAIPIAVVWMAPTPRQIWVLMLAFGIGTAASTLYGLPQHAYRNAGFTYHPVALAYTAMLTLSFVPYLVTFKMRGRWLAVVPVAAIALVAVWTSGSRTDVVVLGALVILIPVLERSLRLGLLVTAGCVLLIPAMAGFDPKASSTSALSRMFGDGGASHSDTTRLGTIHDALGQIQANPFFGNGYSVDHTYVIHNIYLQVLAAEGIFGLIGLLLMFIAFLVPLNKASALRRCLVYPALAVILAGPFQPNMGDHYLGMSLGLSLLAAVGVSAGRHPPDAQFPPTRPDALHLRQTEA